MKTSPINVIVIKEETLLLVRQTGSLRHQDGLIPLALLHGGDNLVGLGRYPYEVEEIVLGFLVDIVGCVGHYDNFATLRDAAREKSRRSDNRS